MKLSTATVAVSRPVHPTFNTAEHNATLHDTDPSRRKKKPVRLTGTWMCGMGPGGLRVLHMVCLS